ncbi:MAG: hypothetical protein RMI34_07125 [Chloroherpetonaceae bacterium]|nr:hypothetical protein [Chloroherpetonaceae bacterium]MCS7211536.1 hypothetical protein [Chloroherpetonaceae bacterium]MDW8019830.1 hypothetical protein [Chloroherpetonaceae bacterium]MDW8465103.1 hypothetical protein [Chloroherpetonaceae bacterium]
MKVRCLLFLIGFLLWADAAELMAQPVPAAPPRERERWREGHSRPRIEPPSSPEQMSPERRAQFIARLRQLRIWKLTDRLKMTEEQSIRFFPKYNRYQDEYFAKVEQLHAQMRELRELEAKKAPDSELDKQVEKILATRTEMSGLFSKYAKEFREVLTAQQLAELMLFERDFLDDLNRLMRRERPDTTRPMVR